MKKRTSLLIIFLTLSTPLLMFQYSSLYNYGTKEEKLMDVTFFSPSKNKTHTEEVKITIIKPPNQSQKKYPACIVLNGDLTNLDSVLVMKKQLINNNFIVVTLEFSEYSPKIYFHLNTTLNYLVGQNYINSDQIGVFGYSRGAHYAFYFGSMRTDRINSVICGNFGTLKQIYNDYYRYYLEYIDWEHSESKKEEFYSNPFDVSQQEFQNCSLLSHKQSPNNLLLLTNSFDAKAEKSTEKLLSNLTDGGVYENNQLYGSFSTKNAKKISVSTRFFDSIFGHSSSVLAPSVIDSQISWLTYSYNLKLELRHLTSIRVDVSFFLLSCLILIVLGFGGLYLSILGVVLQLLSFDRNSPKNKELMKGLFTAWVVIESVLFPYLLTTNYRDPRYIGLLFIYFIVFMQSHLSKLKEIWTKGRLSVPNQVSIINYEEYQQLIKNMALKNKLIP